MQGPPPMQVLGYVSRVRNVDSNVNSSTFTSEEVEANPVRCPDPEAAEAMYRGGTPATSSAVGGQPPLAAPHSTAAAAPNQHAARLGCTLRLGIVELRLDSLLIKLPSAAAGRGTFTSRPQSSCCWLLRVSTVPATLQKGTPDSQCCLPAAIDEVRTRGDSCGGVVTCVVRGCPKGLGMPVFGKLEAELAGAVMSLPASKVSNSTASGSLPHCDLKEATWRDFHEQIALMPTLVHGCHLKL